MNWDIPTWWAFLLLALAAFRLWRLLSQDDVLDRPRIWVLLKAPKIEPWLLCAWCSGAWVSVGWWLAWCWSAHWSLVVATPFAISAVVGLVAVNLDKE